MYRCRTTYDEWKCIIAKNRVGKVMDIKSYVIYLVLNARLQQTKELNYMKNLKDILNMKK